MCAEKIIWGSPRNSCTESSSFFQLCVPTLCFNLQQLQGICCKYTFNLHPLYWICNHVFVCCMFLAGHHRVCHSYLLLIASSCQSPHLFMEIIGAHQIMAVKGLLQSTVKTQTLLKCDWMQFRLSVGLVNVLAPSAAILLACGVDRELWQVPIRSLLWLFICNGIAFI